MEAVAKHDFTATAKDELSFGKNDILKVINKEEDQNWYKAEFNGAEGYVPNNYIELKPHEWFVGNMKRKEAEDLLLQRVGNQFVHPDGAFLVRNSESAPGDFSMSVNWFVGNMRRMEAENLLLAKSGANFVHRDGSFLVRGCESQPGEFSISVKFQDGVQHFKILRDGGGRYFLWVVKFNSINELIEYHRTSSVSRGQTICLKDMKPLDQHDQFQRRLTAMFDFKSEDSNELSLKKGDTVILENELDTNWWRGTNPLTGKTGLFPANYVKNI